MNLSTHILAATSRSPPLPPARRLRLLQHRHLLPPTAPCSQGGQSASHTCITHETHRQSHVGTHSHGRHRWRSLAFPAHPAGIPPTAPCPTPHQTWGHRSKKGERVWPRSRPVRGWASPGPPGPFPVLSQQRQPQLLAAGEHSPSCLEPREGRL